MNFANYTPFPGDSWESFDHTGRIFQTTLIRAKYRFQPQENGEVLLKLDPVQGELLPEEQYYGESSQSSIRYSSDYVNYKPQVDIIVNANTHSPNSEPANIWETGISVHTEQGACLLDVAATVIGPCYWQRKTLRGWTLSEPENITRLPLKYEYIYGGTRYSEAKEGEEAELLCFSQENPIGKGILHKKQVEQRADAAQIYHQSTLDLVDKPYAELESIGFSAIANSWKGRIEYAGTYDKDWLDNRFPMPPENFNPLYNQQAHPVMRIPGGLPFGSIFTLKQMLAGQSTCQFSIPELVLYRFLPRRKHRARLQIDTVLIDINSDHQDDWSVFVSYRLYEIKPLREKALQLVLDQGVQHG